MKKILITGTTSGLGKSLYKIYSNNHSVYTINRKDCDLSDLSQVSSYVKTVCKNIDHFEYVFLNAGMLGDLKKINEIDIKEYKKIFDVNVWSNKIIIDYLIQNNKAKKVIGISSGAAIKTYFGWSLYCSSKAAFKQMLSCYNQECTDIEFLSLAPGVIKTKMQDYIKTIDFKQVPSVKKFQDMYPKLPTPEECAYKIYNNIDLCFSKSKDSYFDIRNLDE